MSTIPEATSPHNLTKLLILLPLTDNSKSTFQCETPCNMILNFAQECKLYPTLSDLLVIDETVLLDLLFHGFLAFL